MLTGHVAFVALSGTVNAASVRAFLQSGCSAGSPQETLLVTGPINRHARCPSLHVVLQHCVRRVNAMQRKVSYAPQAVQRPRCYCLFCFSSERPVRPDAS